MAITNDNDFKIAAGYAKAIAAHNDKAELTPLIYLLGVVYAYKQNALNEEVPVLKQITDKVIDLAKDRSLKFDELDGPLDNQTFPLNTELKGLIKSCMDLKLIDLVQQLAKKFELISEPEEDNLTPEIVDDPAFLKINAYAAKLSAALSLKPSEPELFAISALVALNRGDLDHRPSLSAHLNAYSREFNAWLNDKGIQSFDELVHIADTSVEESGLPGSHPIEAYKSSKNPFIALLNAGIDKVAETRNRECTAYHEAGHAIVSLVLRPKVSLDRVTIVPTERYDGCTFFDDTNPIYKHVFPCSREDFLEDLCVSLAGQASQLKKYGFNSADVGAQSDYAGATEYAWQYITEFGLDDAFGPIQLSVLSRKYSIKSGWLFDEAQKRLQAILKEAQQKTEIILSEHWDCVERVVEGLLKNKTLDEDEVRALMTPFDSKR